MALWLTFLLGFWFAWALARAASLTFSEWPAYAFFFALVATLITLMALLLVGVMAVRGIPLGTAL